MYKYAIFKTEEYRVYYAYIEEQNILLLLGGNKNGQNKDITRARKILSKKIEN